MKHNTQPKIFLSYAWANAMFANEIYTDFKATGVAFQRDVREVNYNGSIKDLMAKIGQNDFVALLISDDFIKSENCMHEITQLLCAPEFAHKVLPITVNHAAITAGKEQEKYYYYWQDRVEEANRICSIYPGDLSALDKKNTQAIYDTLGIFFARLEDLCCIQLEKLRARNYKQLLDKIHFQDQGVVGKIMDIARIEEEQEQEHELVYIWAKYPDNENVLFFSAYSAEQRQAYDIARQRFEAMLWLYPGSSVGHYYYALLLKNYFSDYDKAREHYEKAIELNPHYAEAHNNYAILLAKYFSAYTEAKEHYAKTIELNPHNAEAYNNYALLLAKHFSQYDDARAYLEMAIEVDPQYANAHNNLACLLETNFEDYEEARLHYEIAIRISRRHELARTNLAILIKNHFS